MSSKLTLADLEACFEGVIPSIISTADADGLPNISYLSHVAMVDDRHVALSNQFFAKTAANIRLNPHAMLLLVDARNSAQFRLQLVFAHTLEAGPLFEHISLQIDASSAQVGMAGIMKLRNLDVFRVVSIEAIPSQVETAEPLGLKRNRLIAAAKIADAIAAEADADGIIDAMLDGLRTEFGFEHGLLLQLDEGRNQLITIGSIGYAPSGIGSDIPVDEGVIGAAAAGGRLVKLSDMSRIRRFGAAVRDSSADENRTRAIPLPGMPDAMSQIAVPLIAAGSIRGVLFLESRDRIAFTGEDEAALSVIARQAAMALALSEKLSLETEPQQLVRAELPTSEKTVQVVHHRFDDSIFVDGDYVIKGVAGRLLASMLEQYQESGRVEFTNREIRLDAALKLPDFKDNLETRLLLLRRRLDEKRLPIRLSRLGRGRIGLLIEGALRLSKDVV
ncbi:GAF domain-containing protein [Rhizobium leguminosarum]|uniref:GAF domain-containing protein n=1 Tax=Rhizobium leguminosarum TaxID=384 RepID=UPI001C9588CC|nr:GAF domain-containing protein [Rhizobium leguminosarum]MBY5819529.1 GAF domain-containing protein [Rhizobium leguminosarum]